MECCGGCDDIIVTDGGGCDDIIVTDGGGLNETRYRFAWEKW